MTDATDIKALRELLCHGGLEIDYHVGVTVKTLRLLLSKADQLEAERQRADKSDAMLSECLESLKAAEAELAALKGEQVPKYWAVVSGYSTEFKHSRKDAEHYLNNVNGMFIEELFTAPQLSVYHPDKLRMDWLCAHVVEVRQPLMYGSHAMFYGQCDSDDCEEYHSTLREQIDAAIEAAGGIVKDGE